MVLLRLVLARLPRVLLLAVGLVAACNDGPTSLLLAIDGPASVASLELTVSLASGAELSRSLPLGTDGKMLPGDVVVELPDAATVVTIHLAALVDGVQRSADASVTSRPHRQVKVPLSLGAPSTDLAPPDLTGVQPDDLAIPIVDQAVGDQRAADLASTDLAAVTPTLSVVVGKYGGGGNHDDVGLDARFEVINGLVLVGTTGYIAEYWSGRLRSFDPTTRQTATITLTRASDGAATSLDSPTSLASGGNGFLYTCSNQNSIVERIEIATGKVDRVAGAFGMPGTADGDAATARFDHPSGLDFDGAGTLWVADQGNKRLRRIVLSPAVSVSTPAIATAGGGLDMATPFMFNSMRGLRYSGGALWVADEGGVVKVDLSTTPALATIFVPRNKLVAAAHIAISGDSLYVTDEALNTVWRFVLASPLPGTLFAGGNTFSTDTLDGDGTAARFYLPRWLFTDPSGAIYLSEDFAIRKLDVGGGIGHVSTIVGRGRFASPSVNPARLDSPSGLWFDGVDTFWFGDAGGNDVRKWVRSTNTLSIVAGSGGYDHQDGLGLDAKFDQPRGIVGDKAGLIYVSDTVNRCVRKIDGAGNVTTIVGHPKVPGPAPATDNLDGAAVYLGAPDGLVFDGDQTLFLADAGNGVVLRISLADATYKTSIVAGDPTKTGYKNATVARPSSRRHRASRGTARASGCTFLIRTRTRRA